jgi:predicted signal transduction protein with EAL and GGDEF domain
MCSTSSAASGVTSITSSRFATHEILAQADMACQTAKTNGRNRVEFYNVSGKLNERMAQDIHWTRTIRNALEKSEFVLHYQPLMHIKTQSITHYEALLRPQNQPGPGRASILLPAVSRFGLMGEIDRWVVERAIQALAEFERRGITIASVGKSDEVFVRGRFVCIAGADSVEGICCLRRSSLF